jgi:hypothetical protein
MSRLDERFWFVVESYGLKFGVSHKCVETSKSRCELGGLPKVARLVVRCQMKVTLPRQLPEEY